MGRSFHESIQHNVDTIETSMMEKLNMAGTSQDLHYRYIFPRQSCPPHLLSYQHTVQLWEYYLTAVLTNSNHGRADFPQEEAKGGR
jgi:hypothetical protein